MWLESEAKERNYSRVCGVSGRMAGHQHAEASSSLPTVCPSTCSSALHFTSATTPAGER